MPGSGLPLLVMLAWNDWSAPSSTEVDPGESKTVMSLRMVTPALEDLEGSAWLMAVI